MAKQKGFLFELALNIKTVNWIDSVLLKISDKITCRLRRGIKKKWVRKEHAKKRPTK